ncbi:uncharacterized protein L203_105604 [Cryptococcus depauperatus CBS 7841]|uniref:Uncharacterized protein n=1 Tax=Cryptococcus depauperatus CBS 7841 TaxID=1295531 RepID=A0AAJ8JXM4_9TREE
MPSTHNNSKQRIDLHDVYFSNSPSLTPHAAPHWGPFPFLFDQGCQPSTEHTHAHGSATSDIEYPTGSGTCWRHSHVAFRATGNFRSRLKVEHKGALSVPPQRQSSQLLIINLGFTTVLSTDFPSSMNSFPPPPVPDPRGAHSRSLSETLALSQHPPPLAITTTDGAQSEYLHRVGGFHAAALPFGRYQSLGATLGQKYPRATSRDYSGYSESHRVVANRSPQRGIGHDNRRCARDCRADEAPYRMLKRVIGRASASGLKVVVEKVEGGRVLERERQRGQRPNIQLRRSNKQVPRESSLNGAGPASPYGFKPLSFDSRILSGPPLPPPPVDHICDPQKHVEFFADFASPACRTDEFESIPRSSSAPSVPLLASERRGSDASMGSILSTMSADTPGLKPLTHHPASSLSESLAIGHGQSDPLAASPQTASFVNPQSVSFPHPLGESRIDSADQSSRDPADLSPYLPPEMSATLRRRMLEGSTSRGGEDLAGLGYKVGMTGNNGRWTGNRSKKKETLVEAEWSFETPILKVMGEAVMGKVGLIDPVANYNLVEYGCYRETPNPILAEIIKSLCRSASDTVTRKVFSVTHQATPDFDIRLLQSNLTTHPKSYRKIEQLPSPAPLLLTSFSFAGFADSAVPVDTVHVALCSSELTKLQGPISPRPLYSFTSQAEEKERHAEKDLVRWLKARAGEVKKGGILVCSLAVRTKQPTGRDVKFEESLPQPPKASPYHLPASLPTSPHTNAFTSTHRTHTPLTEVNPSIFATPPHHLGGPKSAPVKYRPDIFQTMSQALSPAIQRLVTLGEIRSHVAPMLVDVPYWSRTLESLKSALAKATEWDVLFDQEGEESVVGDRDYDMTDEDDELDATPIIPPSGDVDEDIYMNNMVEMKDDESPYSPEERREWADAGVRIYRLNHPAWRAYKQGRIDRGAYAKRIATYCHSVYEPHLKKVLREKGRMDISQSENTVQEMFKILGEKCELGALDGFSIDVGVIVLQKK